MSLRYQVLVCSKEASKIQQDTCLDEFQIIKSEQEDTHEIEAKVPATQVTNALTQVVASTTNVSSRGRKLSKRTRTSLSEKGRKKSRKESTFGATPRNLTMLEEDMDTAAGDDDARRTIFLTAPSYYQIKQEHWADYKN